MKSLFTFFTPAHDCAYRSGETARMKYEVVEQITAAEYEAKMQAGWRRFGHSLFIHACPACSACQSIRISVELFQPNRSQRRAWQANADLTLTIAKPDVTGEMLALYDRFHEAQGNRVGWPNRGSKDAASYFESFVQQPFAVEEWQYRIGERLVGIGYVDPLPKSLSAIYFFHEPVESRRSLGTFNVLKVLAVAAERKVPYVYLGYFVEGCRSLEYKARFEPNEIRGPDGVWRPFRTP
jgi:arginine-tRNA-protein transferase